MLALEQLYNRRLNIYMKKTTHKFLKAMDIIMSEYNIKVRFVFIHIAVVCSFNKILHTCEM